MNTYLVNDAEFLRVILDTVNISLIVNVLKLGFESIFIAS